MDNSKNSAAVRDITCKPKPIKAQRHNENPILSHQQIPNFSYSSPKNPIGISPFQPTGKFWFFFLNLFAQVLEIH